jgi:hypothetical protein
MARGIWMAALLMILPLPAGAAAQSPSAPRVLSVPGDTSWQHAATGMVLPSKAGGLSRTEVKDLTAEEMDMIATYREPQSGTVASVYLFRTLLDDVTIWFDRSMVAIADQPAFRGATLAVPPQPFSRPGASAASGLRTVLAVEGSGTRSTALAIAPLGGWLLKIRISSSSEDAAALERRLTAFVAALRWPAERKAGPVAAPVQPCASTLRTKKAKLVKADMGQTLISALMSAAPIRKDTEAYCRDPKPAPTPIWAVYRPGGAENRYVVAMGDAGAALVVSPAVSINELSGKTGAGDYAVTLVHYATSSVLPSFNRLPPPEQAVAGLMQGRGSGISATVR